MTATGGASRQVVVHAATAQLLVPLASTLPLLPGDGAQPPPDPLVQTPQLRRQFTEPKISPPADQIACEVFGNGVQRVSAVAPGQIADPLLEPVQRRRRDPPLRHGSDREAEAQELPVRRLIHCALDCIHPELEPAGEEGRDARHHPFARPAAAHINIAVVGPRVRALRGPRTGSAHEAVTASLQFLIQHVKHQIRQQGRQRAPCGVPSSVGPTNPCAITPAVRKPRMSRNSRRSDTLWATSPIKMSWLTRSKNFSRSMSTTQPYPAAMYSCARATA